MTETLDFYYNPMSRGQIVHWMLEETGVKYNLKILDWKKNEHKSPDYLKINPMGKIPSIVHKGVVVTEGAAICAYLADAFPSAGLAPAAHDPQRGSFYRWLFFTVNCLEPAVQDKNLPRTTQDPPSRLGYGTYETMLKVLEEAVGKGYLVNDKFSAADVYLSSVLRWYFFQKLMPPTPTLEKYVKLCSDRPAYKRFSEQLKKLMEDLA